MLRLLLACLVVSWLLLTAGLAWAQQPAVTVVWDASPTVGVEYRVYVNGLEHGTTGSLAYVVPHADLVPGEVTLFEVTAFNAAGESDRAGVTFTLPRLPDPPPDARICDPSPVRFAVGSWQDQVIAGGVGYVTFSLRTSPDPVVRVQVMLGGVPQGPPMEAADLRQMYGHYFTVPDTPGAAYDLSATAMDVNGCTATVDRVMTVYVVE